ncbi:hypothetical protein MSAS_21740 [Mycobacterium saskatchewanense]|uniref:Uncharacterized protein n=1 Tax=Mycobacterium saskatchewanense TaxID=220927 RepID=A0AAJ3TWX4_9MYCO|nr:hypothetical protein [Mycobacterium saskatchewanense]ORW74751.1 hypothetical protein AWC23_04100 [Mycobacterium saskatchewanense]BBX63000.1 hypothetical protein MSAS_21740 [Mycobacterium saskatchewanense]
MKTLRFALAAALAAASPFAFVAGPSRADAPGPGEACTVLHATTQDANGRTMWCNPTMTGAHTLVWQYGGPA